jgi:hypothetical protein
MTTVSIGRDLAEQLIDTSLKLISENIYTILTKWNYSTAEKFIRDAKNGVISETEDDAISLMNLIDKREELFQVKGSWEINDDLKTNKNEWAKMLKASRTLLPE